MNATSTLIRVVLLLSACAASGTRAADTPADRNVTLAAKAQATFGQQPGQSFDGNAVTMAAQPPRTHTITLTLPPGKGAEVKAEVTGGLGFAFHWVASGDVEVDMHGERPASHDEYTSYAIEGAQREASGLFTAPFEGAHGWYWKNLGKRPVTVKVTVTGFQTRLFRPGKGS